MTHVKEAAGKLKPQGGKLHIEIPHILDSSKRNGLLAEIKEEYRLLRIMACV